MPAKSDPRDHAASSIVPVRIALLAFLSLALISLRPAAARAQDVLCGDPGDKEVRTLRFEGNTRFTSDELSARVLTTPTSLTRRYLRIVGARRCFPDIGLANDVSNLKTLYRNNGFYDTQVDTIVRPLSSNRVDVVFRITEGQPLLLDSLAITGLDSVPEREAVLRDSILKIGSAAGLYQVYAERDSITNRLRNAGYPKATVFPAFDTHASEHRAEAALDVVPGTRARIGAIAIHNMSFEGGPPKLDSGIVVRLTGIKPGQAYSDRALSDAQRRLYNLTLFRHVGVALDTTFSHGDSIADVDVDLREDLMHQIDSQEGWGQLDCFFLNTQYTDKNFQNQAHKLELTTRFSKLGYGEPAATSGTRNLCYRRYLDADSLASSKVNDYIGATITYPTLFGRALTPSYSAYTERRGQYQAYLRTTDIGFGASATRDISLNTPFRFGYNFEHGATQAEPVVLCAIFSRCTVPEQAEVQKRLALGIASATLQHFTIDNPVAPTRGYTAALETRYSAPFLASDPSLRFFKATGDVAWYRRIVPQVTLAARVRGGFITGGDETNGNRLPPPQERLYAGGGSTVRGFNESQLGPQVYLLDLNAVTVDTIDPTHLTFTSKPNARSNRQIPGGGNLLLVLNGEVRIRDPFFPNVLEYVPFIDAGQVWISQVEKTSINKTRLAVTPGLGFRYFSPFGPIQANVGYNPYPPRPGPAYFLPAATENSSNQNRPLICVTRPGETPLVVIKQGNELVQPDVQSCPSTFQPAQATGFFRHFTLTFSIGTDF